MKRLALSDGTVARARSLRRGATDAERALWRGLRVAIPQARFRRQVPLGPYFADFASHSARLVVEVDGGQHAVQVERDAARTRFLEGEGYRVLRFWNNDVLANTDGVLETIAASILPAPPCGEGRVGAPATSVADQTPCALTDSAAIFPAADAARPHPVPPHKGEGSEPDLAAFAATHPAAPAATQFVPE